MGIRDTLVRLLFGQKGGATVHDLLALSERDQLSKYLPWVAYDPDNRQFRLQDETVCYIWECAPLFFAGESTTKTLEGLFNQGMPDRTIMQFVLVAEPHVEPILNAHKYSKRRQSRLIRRMSESLCKFYDDGKNGMGPLGGTPLRNYRLFFSVKFPIADAEKINLNDLQVSIHELLKGAHLHPRQLDAPTFLDFLRRFFNDEPSSNNFGWDEGKALRKQCIFAGTEINIANDHIKVGKKIFKALTPQIFPTEVHAFQTNQLFGGVKGMVSDAEQIRTPFIYSLNIITKNLKKMLHTKCNFILGQQAVGSMAPSLVRKKKEYMWAVDEIEKGTRFVRVIPTLWLYGDDMDMVTASLARAKQMWESKGYTMQIDKGILCPLFLTSLPGGLYDVKGNVEQLDRDFVAPIDAVTHILPVQGDFCGFGEEPVIPLIGRKGQLFGIDLWAYNSHNALVCATTGGGKSFLLNHILNNYYGVGAKIRVVDIGFSYKKMTKLHGAKFLDFGPGSDICLNPFSTVSNDPNEPDDTTGDLAAIPGIIAQMAYSSGEGSPSNTDMTLIEKAVNWAWEHYGHGAGSDQVREYLVNFRKLTPDGDGGQEAEDCAKMLAFNMSKFCTGGPYAKFFNGKATFDIANDDFVVLELEHLEQHKSLFKVVTLQVINAVTQDLYLGDRNQKKLIVFDEAWKFLGESNAIKAVIEEGYRRARKYNASFTIITQSLLDLLQFGSVGKVIRSNSAFKFMLQSPDFEQAANEKLIDYSPFIMEMLKSLASNPPKYSEIFIDSPFGVGVGRLVVDQFNYFTNTSSAGEVDMIDGLIDSGISVEDTIDLMVDAAVYKKENQVSLEEALQRVTEAQALDQLAA
jgi:conjugal transfer ATP-binding protein TraC